MKVYYAHFMGTYNTPVEERDIKTLSSLGLEILNPNSKEISDRFAKAKEGLDTKILDNYMKAFEVFFDCVRECEVFAFRGLPNGRIPGGVAKELEVAIANNKIIIELPCSMISRSMGGEETREYLRDMGER